MRQLRTLDWILLALVILCFVPGLAYYGRLPAQMPLHWALDGQPDVFAPKPVALFLLPVANLALFFSMRGGRANRLLPRGRVAEVIVPVLLLGAEVWMVAQGLR